MDGRAKPEGSRNRHEHLIEAATEKGLGFINASPFNQGLLAGVDPAEIERIRTLTNMWAARSADVARAQRIWQWARDSGVNLRAMAIQFSLREPRIASTLIGPRNLRELEEDLEAAVETVPDEHWHALNDLLPNLPPPAPGGEAASGAYPPDH